jgi:hypothetical protein
MKPALPTKEAVKSVISVIKAIYFGLDEQLLLNVTASVIEHCMSNADGTWTLPGDDAVRASLFGDPIPNVLKKVYVRVLTADGKNFSEIVILSSDTVSFDYQDGRLSLAM